MTERPATYAVIAGTYQQFRAWCRENGVQEGEAIYWDVPHRVFGRRGLFLIRTGEHWLSKVQPSDIDRALAFHEVRVAWDAPQTGGTEA